jgi:hypothetical protein
MRRLGNDHKEAGDLYQVNSKTAMGQVFGEQITPRKTVCCRPNQIGLVILSQTQACGGETIQADRLHILRPLAYKNSCELPFHS